MELEALEAIRDAAWLYIAAPAILLGSILLTARLAFPQARRVGAAFRALRAHDSRVEGELTPRTAVLLSAAASFGAAGAVGAATAIALGGAGAIAWAWLIGFVLAPLRMAEVLLARTDAAARGDARETGSLARRLLREASPAYRAIGVALLGLTIAAALALAGGLHGAAIAETAEALAPKSALWLGLGVAGAGALLGVGGARRAGALAGWIALVGLAALVVACLLAAASDPGRAFGGLARAIGEAWDGAPTAAPFIGAVAGEVARVSIVQLLPPIGGATGMDGAIHGAASAATTRGQAAAAMIGPLAYAIAATLLGVAAVGTGAYTRAHADKISMAKVVVYDIAPETPSQQEEEDRLRSGPLRVQAGELRDLTVDVATERGTIESPRFDYYGKSADLAFFLDHGRPVRVMRPRAQERGSLSQIPLAQVREVVISGDMLPQRAGVLRATMRRAKGGGAIAGGITLAALLALAACALAAWGYAAAYCLGRRTHPAVAGVVRALPAIGVALAATGIAPWLSPVGGLIGAALATVSIVALALLSGEAAKLAKS